MNQNHSTTISCARKPPVRSTVSSFVALVGSVLVAVFCGAGTVCASTQVYTPVYGQGTSFPGAVSFQGGMVVGSIFRANSSVTFNSLGFIDLNNADPYNNAPGDGLLGSYDVGIWLVSSQQLLASAMVTTDSTLIGDFRYSAIAPTTISAGQTFIIGALLPDNLLDGYLTNMTDLISNPNVSGIGGGRFTLGATTLSYPTTIMDGNAVALANASDAIVPAPEPSTTALLVSFGCLVMFWRRRRATATN